MNVSFEDYLEIETATNLIPALPDYTKLIVRKINEKFLMNTSIPRMLIVTMPPRSLKTTIASKLLPMWIAECFPYRHIGLFSYSEHIVDLNKKKLPKTLYYKIANMHSGVESQIDTFIIDDYYKSDNEAKSIVTSESIFNKFENIINTKLMANSFVLIMSSRWNKSDLIGRIFNNLKTKGMVFFVDYINLTAISNKFDPFGRKPNESFWPEKYSLKILLDIQKKIGKEWFESLYQGMPIE